jgi:hypothetical protein
MKPLHKSLLSVVLGIGITLWPAIYNHYVVVFTDSELYINCGNEFSYTEDRSFVYGWFVGITSLHISLWFTIIAQAILFNLSCYVFVKQNLKEYTDMMYVALVSFLSLFTALAWDVCYIMPDVFSAISILLLAIIMQHKRPFTKTWFAWLVFYLLSLQMHFSFMLFHCLALSILLIIRLITFGSIKGISTTATSILFFGVLANIGFFSLEKKALGADGFSNVSHIFLMGKLVENGVLKSYLDAECVNKNYEICKYKDSLAPENYSGNFLFHPNSAFQKTGAWGTPHDEYKIIINDILFTPKYAWQYAKSIIIEATKSFSKNKIGNSIYAYPQGGWGPYPAIAKYYPKEMNAYNSSLQNRSEITFPFQVISKMYVFMLIVSALGLIYLTRKKTTIIFMIGLAIISNAIITGGLVGLEDRYSTRQNYLIILLFLVILSNSVFTFLKKDKKDSIF